MSRTYFAAQLSACLEHAGYDPGLYKCHSFRIGAATSAATRSFTDRQTQTMGRWKSAAFKRYIHIINCPFTGAAAAACLGFMCTISYVLVWQSGWSGSRAGLPILHIRHGHILHTFCLFGKFVHISYKTSEVYWTSLLSLL